MTIAVVCNLADGVVLGADSAVTIRGTTGRTIKVYNDTEKLFTLWDRPVAMVTYGAADLVGRTIRSHVREFESTHQHLRAADATVGELCQHLWLFLNGKYRDAMAQIGLDFAGTPVESRPGLGLLVGGFGSGQYLSEVWELVVQADTEGDGILRLLDRGVFGARWRGMTDGIDRFHNGMSLPWVDGIIDAILAHYGIQADPALPAALEQRILEIIRSARYQIPFAGMPLQEGVQYVRFLLDIMINQTRFVVGSPRCGGRVRIVVVQHDSATWVTETPFTTTH